MISSSQSRTEKLFVAISVAMTVLVLLFLITPILAIVPLSFTGDSLLSYPIEEWSLRWYRVLWETPVWLTALKNSLIIGVGATILATILGTSAAIGLNRPQCPWPELVTAFLMVPMIVPVIITAVASYFFYGYLGLTGSFLGMIIAHTVLGTPFVVITVSATLKGIDPNQRLAAYSLGARPIRAFFTVTLPQILPGVVFGALFAFVTSFDEVIIALFIADIDQYTLPRRMFSGIRENLDPTIAAVATVLIVISLCVLGIGQLLMWLRTRRQNGRRN